MQSPAHAATVHPPLKMWKKLPRHEGYISSGTVQLEKTGSCMAWQCVRGWAAFRQLRQQIGLRACRHGCAKLSATQITASAHLQVGRGLLGSGGPQGHRVQPPVASRVLHFIVQAAPLAGPTAIAAAAGLAAAARCLPARRRGLLCGVLLPPAGLAPGVLVQLWHMERRRFTDGGAP